MVILVTYKNEEDLIKYEDTRVATTLNIDFSNTQRQLTPQSEVESGRNWNSSEKNIDVLVTSKNEENRIKNEGARVPTTLNIDFSNRQEQLTPQSRVESGQNSNSFEIL